MPHVTVHFHHDGPGPVTTPDAAGRDALSAQLVSAVTSALGCDPEVVTVSLAPTAPNRWDDVLSRAVVEGPFLRRPAYPTGVSFDA